jgi:hypothetical protein
MKFKKRILVSAIALVSISSANQFKIIIDGEDVSYIADKPVSSDTTYTEWTRTGETNCSFSPLDSNVYSGESFNQDKTCDILESRIATTTVTYKSGKTVTEDKTESRVNPTPETTQITSTGTHLEANCKDIKAFDNSLVSNKNYPLVGGSTAFCDMTTDGGGWTLVDSVVQPSFAVVPNIKTLSSNGLSYNDVYFKDTGTYVSYAAPYDNNLDYQGFQEAITRIKSSGNWVTYTSLDYTIINESNSCYYLHGDTSYRCATDLVIKNVSNVEGLSDIETVNLQSYTDNSSKYNFEFYVR